MSIVMFIMFFLMDIGLVGIFMFVYSGKDQYSEGMLLGVHIPQDQVNHEEVVAIVKAYKKNSKRMNRWNLLIGAAICGLCFWNFSIFMLVWFVWLFAYIFAAMGVVYRAHWKMYQVKMKYQWIVEGNTHVVHIDTAVSAMTQKFPVSHWWNLCVVAGMGVTFLLPDVQFYFRNELTAWIFPGTLLLTAFLFWGMHLWFGYRRNNVYSEDSAINMSVNRIEKRAWSIVFLCTNYLNLFSWCYLVFRLQISHWLYSTDFFVYIGLQMLPVIFLLAGVFYIIKKRKMILSMDTVPVVVDDDEYWKYGWYNNPNDTRLLVQDRLCSTNYSMNMGRKAARVVTVATAIFIGVMMIFIVIMMAMFENVQISFAVQGSEIKAEAVMYHSDIQIADIQSVQIIDKLPEDSYIKTNGGDSDKYMVGHFRGKETGTCMMFLYKNYQPLLKIQLADETIYANSQNPDDVQLWYQEIQEQIAADK